MKQLHHQRNYTSFGVKKYFQTWSLHGEAITLGITIHLCCKLHLGTIVAVIHMLMWQFQIETEYQSPIACMFCHI